ncbi:MAG: MATE family efflux transporter [Faecalibacterium sp.]
MSQLTRFYRFVIPSIAAMMVTGLYFIVDGIFVGQGGGADALGMINLATPFISVMTSISMMITMGGATIAAIGFGRGERAQANQVFNISLWMVIFLAAIMSAIALCFGEQIAHFLGASGGFVAGTVTYLTYYTLFGIFFCGSMLLSAFIRNDDNPRLAFWGMMSGAISNIFFDWLFIFPLGLGLQGAAMASGVGQIFSCLVLSTHFIRKKGALRLALPRFEGALCLRILRVGAPEFVTHMSQPVITFCYNLIIVAAFGEIGISAFSAASYLLWVILYIFIGLAQGVQPLLSISFGEGDIQKERYFLHTALKVGIVLSVGIYAIIFFLGRNIITVFSTDIALIEIAYHCLLVYGLSFVFSTINVIFTTYYLSTERTKAALQITVLRSLVVNAACIFLVPMLFGAQFIWAGIVVAEAGMSLFVWAQAKWLVTK